MKKKNSNSKNNIVEISAAVGFMIGSTLWFWIYFPKADLAFDKMIIYMFAGFLFGGILGEIVAHFKNK